MKLPVLLVAIVMCSVVMLLSGCSAGVTDIPPGYIGKILTPTGWEQAEPRGAGQVDLGASANNGTENKLVICESSSTTIKELFRPADPQSQDANLREDHRVLTSDGIPASVDVYVQVGVINEKKWIDSIFAQITPVPDPGAARRA